MPRRRLLAALAFAAAAVAAAAMNPGAPDEVFGGLPYAQQLGQRWATHVLRNPGFVVGYSEWRRQPLWVAYRAGILPNRRLGPRPERFETDPRVWWRVSSDDYRNSDYDRGHLAPNYLIGRLYGPEAQRATFLMSNVTPQRPRLNALVWQRLEEAEADDVAPAAGTLWVVTGPVFGEAPARIGRGVPVPEAFYRIWVDARDTAAPRVLAFVVPQQVCGTEPLSQYLASVDEVERRTGLDFLRTLDDALEDGLEAAVRPAEWSLPRFDRRAPRYADKFGPLQC